MVQTQKCKVQLDQVIDSLIRHMLSYDARNNAKTLGLLISERKISLAKASVRIAQSLPGITSNDIMEALRRRSSKKETSRRGFFYTKIRRTS